MTMSKNIVDREYTKFVEDADGNTSIRVVSGIQDNDGDKLSVSPQGEAFVTSLELVSIFNKMLEELQIIRAHMEIGSNTKLENGDT